MSTACKMNRPAGVAERSNTGRYLSIFTGIKKDIDRGFKSFYSKRGMAPPMVSTRAITPWPESWVQSFDVRRGKFY